MTASKSVSHKDMNGLKVINLGTPTAGSNDAARQVEIEAAIAFARARANHLGTQLAATISDFDVQVRTNRLDQLTAPTNPVSMATQRLTAVADPNDPQDAATRNYVDVAFAGLASGQTLKGTVRAASTSNVNIASAPATINGITPALGDVFLLEGQTDGSQNGPYVWNGAAVAMTRAPNWDTNAEAVVGSYWIVREGTLADRFALLTNDTFTLGTTAAAFVHMAVAPEIYKAVEQTIGDGSATTFTVTHNFGTRAVKVEVYRNSSPWDTVDVYVDRPTVNSITVQPDVVFGLNEFNVVVARM